MPLTEEQCRQSGRHLDYKMLRVKDPVIHHHVMQHGPESPWPSCNGRTGNAVSMSMSSKLITMARSHVVQRRHRRFHVWNLTLSLTHIVSGFA